MRPFYNCRSIILACLIGLSILQAGCQSTARQQEAPAERPNILFVIADDASYLHFGAYGVDWVQTPAFDRVASEGILFNRAYTPNAKCAPSRSAILTGRNSWQLEEAANHWPYFPQQFTTYPEVLSDQGYHVGYTGKGWAPGIAETASGEPRDLVGPAYHEHTVDPPADQISSKDYASNFEAFLNDRSADQPFCFWYGGHEPHRGYEYGVGLRQGNEDLEDIDRVFSFWPDNDTVRTDMLDYAFEIEYFDSHLQRMLSLLEERGELDNTIVVVTSDNGMPFPRIKGQKYELSHHMPLAIMWKGGIQNPGRIVEDHVSFIDFAPTFLELAGVPEETSGMQPIEGRSLTDIFRSRRGGQVNPERNHVLIGKERHDVGRPNDQGYPVRGIVTDDYVYLHNFEPDRWPAGNPETGYLNTDGSPTKTVILDGRKSPATQRYWEQSFGKRPAEELYRIPSDLENVINLADDPTHQPLKNRLREQLFSELREQEDPRMFGRGHVFDEYTYADDAHRNFYERYMSGENIEAGWVNESDFEPNFPE